MAESIEKGRKRDDFTSGVLVLSLSAIIVKIIGLIYKIPMLGLLGSEGMGYFNSAYEIYVLFCSVATTGLPVAMSVMISSEKEKGASSIFKAALKLFLFLGSFGAVIAFLCAKPFAIFLGSGNAAFSILAIAPCVFLICLSSAYRGYFQGKGKMMPTAVSQIIEALGKLVLGLIFAYVALNSGADTPIVAAMAAVGLTLGTASSALFLILFKRFDKDSKETVTGNGQKGLISKLLKVAVPVTLSSMVVSVTKVIDMSLILRRLQALGYQSTEAFAAYGNYTTLAIPLFSLAPALVASVAMPLIPALGRAIGEGDCDGQISACEKAIKLTAFISMPVGMGLTLFSRPVLLLIFSGERDAAEVTAPLLAILGLSVTMSCLITVGNAILQTYGKPVIPIISVVAGSIVKILLGYILIGNENFGLLGAPISTFFCDAVINAVNFYFIGKSIPKKMKLISLLVPPFASALVSVTVARVAYNVIASKLGEGGIITICTIGLSALLYFIASLITGAIGINEISAFIPKRRKLSINR